MKTAMCWLILILLKHALMVRAVPNDDYILRGRTHPDDENACFWFHWQDGKSIFRCCNGTQKSDWGDITESCTECPDGSFGNNCEHNCTCQHGGICNKANGFCTCINNYFGNNCQYACNCENGGTCLPDGSCICSNMFYGALCQISCACPVDRKCHERTKECICQDGYYDSYSLLKCFGNSTNDQLKGNCTCNSAGGDKITSCLPCNCSGNGRCDPLTGHCTCNPGYYGDHCDKQCSCYNGAICSDADSDCKCAIGWKGPNCTDCDLERGLQSEQLFCGDKCFHCYNGDICRVRNDDCKCTPGWKGNRCDQKCDEGFYGYYCSQQCECVNGLCDHVNGSCKCDEGWIGHHCEHRCPEHCVKCKDDICLSCKHGWTGVHCNITCKDGYYGADCKQECPRCYCTDSCNLRDGSCMDEVSCQEQSCNCKNGVRCFESKFYCECQNGWSGRFCDVENSTGIGSGKSILMSSHTTTHFILSVFIILTPVIILPTMIVLYCLWKKKRNHEYFEENDMYEMGPSSSSHEYENIRSTPINHCQDYQPLREFSHSQYQILDTSSKDESCSSRRLLEENTEDLYQDRDTTDYENVPRKETNEEDYQQYLI